jgi:hypothetical protein
MFSGRKQLAANWKSTCRQVEEDHFAPSRVSYYSQCKIVFQNKYGGVHVKDIKILIVTS